MLNMNIEWISVLLPPANKFYFFKNISLQPQKLLATIYPFKLSLSIDFAVDRAERVRKCCTEPLSCVYHLLHVFAWSVSLLSSCLKT